MTAFRWILFCLVAFGVGTGAAFAMHPPTTGIPVATAQKLAGDLDAIKGYAAEGRCDAVRGRLDGAQSRISKLPPDTSTELVNQLQQALQDVSSAARATCQQVADAEAAAEQKRREAEQAAEEAAQATTPPPIVPPEPTTPDPGAADGGPDPGTGEDTTGGVTTPDPGDTSGGGVVPDLEGAQQQLERQLEKERQKWQDRLRKIEERWAQ